MDPVTAMLASAVSAMALFIAYLIKLLLGRYERLLDAYTVERTTILTSVNRTVEAMLGAITVAADTAREAQRVNLENDRDVQTKLQRIIDLLTQGRGGGAS